MKINKTLIKFIAAPWVFVAAFGVITLFVIGCGGDTSVDFYLLHKLGLFANIAVVFDIISILGYLSFPHIAGLICVFLAKNWKKVDRLASISAGLQYDAISKGGYYHLYKKGVKTYNAMNRRCADVRTKSKAV